MTSLPLWLLSLGTHLLTGWRLTLSVALVGGLLSGCSWLLGYDRLPVTAARETPEVVEQAYVDNCVTMAFSWLGPGQLQPAAYHPWGRVARAVNPYGPDVWCIQARVQRIAESKAPIFLPERATLRTGSGRVLSALTLSDFRRRWPQWALTSDEQAADRQTAYAYILDTLWIERQVLPGDVQEGFLVFPRGPLGESATLEFPYRESQQLLTATAAWVF
jgi:hypothetical protein